MKKQIITLRVVVLAIATILVVGMSVSCGSSRATAMATSGATISGGLKDTPKQIEVAKRWKNFSIPRIDFEDKAPNSEGSHIYHALIANPEAYINKVAREVLNTLYYSEKDSIPRFYRLHYTLEDTDGVSAKGGGGGNVTIFYSTRHIQRSFVNNDTARVDFETRGVLLHELTHAFQLEPQGIGDYGSNKTFWAFIEGMADAVRVVNDGFHGEKDRPKGGNYKDGYRYTGYFLAWIQQTKDHDFLKKFNRTAIEVIPWSWDGAVQKCLGKNYTMDGLWHEYQVAMGDVK